MSSTSVPSRSSPPFGRWPRSTGVAVPVSFASSGRVHNPRLCLKGPRPSHAAAIRAAGSTLDEENAVRDSATLQALGFLRFVDGREEQLLAGLGATYGMGEDGPLVITSEEVAKVHEILARVGIDPASFDMAEDDFESPSDEGG